MKKVKIQYDVLLDIYRIEDIYHTIRVNTKNKQKLIPYEMFLSSNLIRIYVLLKEHRYRHSTYNIFLLREPKYRIIMSEQLSDKIVNHLVAEYILSTVIEPILINENVATRRNEGTKAGIFYTKKYINRLKNKSDTFYILKCDIKKYFYNIDHEILKEKLKKIIDDEASYEIICDIISSTNRDYINEEIEKIVSNEKKKLIAKNPKNLASQLRILDAIPLYVSGKGLPIGNVTSQILAIFYLNDLDHFIKEKLHIREYIRYMDDFVLMHKDKEYLKYCLGEIKKKLEEEKLSLNTKTQIYDIRKGFPFLGYKFVLKRNKLIVLINNQTKRRIKKKMKFLEKHSVENEKSIRASYNGYLKGANAGSLKRKLGFSEIKK